MKKINEEILRYLSGMLNETDKLAFEEKLKTSEELVQQFNFIKEIRAGFKKQDINVDENYFINMVPRFREKINSRRITLRKAVYYLAPTLTILILAVLLYPHSNTGYDNYYRELAEIVVDNIDDAEVLNNYLSYINLESEYTVSTANDEFTIGLENSINKIPDSYRNMVEFSNMETFYSLENISDEELNNLYEELNEFKFQ